MSRYKFASGAEEKVIRTFEAPRNFVDNFRRICQITEDEEGDIISCCMYILLKFFFNFKVFDRIIYLIANQFGPRGASVPSLGLSNKAVYTDDNIEQAISVDKRNPYPEESHFVASDLTGKVREK